MTRDCDFCMAKNSVVRDTYDEYESVVCSKCGIGDDLYLRNDDGTYVYKELIPSG